MVNKIIPGTHLEGENELTIKDSGGGVLWKKSFEIGSNDHQVSLIFVNLINSFQLFRILGILSSHSLFKCYDLCRCR